MSKWYLSDPIAVPPRSVDFDAGIIYGAAINTVGEAKGHGVMLDSDFVENVARLGNDQGKGGIKVRFGHPTMCGNALLDAPFIGRAKNFSTDGDVTRADIFLSNSASDTPAGDLRARVLNLAAEDPDMFGTSIVFTPGESYKLDADGEKVFQSEASFAQIDGDTFATIDKLHGADIVDEPAANPGGLFSAVNAESFAAIATDFLDNNQRLFQLLIDNPEVFTEFMARYSAYRDNSDQLKEKGMSNQTIEQVEDVELDSTVEEQAELGTTETASEDNVVVFEIEVDLDEDGDEAMSFEAAYDAFGATFAEYVREEKFTADEAKDAYIDFLRGEIDSLTAERDSAVLIGEDEPAEFAAVSEDAEDNAAEHHAAELELKGVSRGVARFAASLNLDNE